MAATCRRTRAAGTTAPAGRCYRAGGNICYADTPEAINREHAILGADRCVAVNPSDTAPALIALDAQMVVRTAGGGELIDRCRGLLHRAGDRHHADDDPAAGRSAHRHPAARARWGGARFYFEKVRDRQVWDFALVSVASAMVMNGSTDRAHAARRQWRRGASAAARRRSRSIARGKPRNEATAWSPANLAIEGAQPLKFNAYKVPLMRNLVKRAIRGVEEGTWTS